MVCSPACIEACFVNRLDAGQVPPNSLSAELRDAVAEKRDRVFGSTVTSVLVGSFFYDGKEVTFGYSLADGRSGIAIATVPEPSSLVLACVAALGLMVVAGGRRSGNTNHQACAQEKRCRIRCARGHFFPIWPKSSPLCPRCSANSPSGDGVDWLIADNLNLSARHPTTEASPKGR